MGGNIYMCCGLWALIDKKSKTEIENKINKSTHVDDDDDEEDYSYMSFRWIIISIVMSSSQGCNNQHRKQYQGDACKRPSAAA